MSNVVNVDFVTRAIEITSDGKENVAALATAADRAVNARKEIETVAGTNYQQVYNVCTQISGYANAAAANATTARQSAESAAQSKNTAETAAASISASEQVCTSSRNAVNASAASAAQSVQAAAASAAEAKAYRDQAALIAVPDGLATQVNSNTDKIDGLVNGLIFHDTLKTGYNGFVSVPGKYINNVGAYVADANYTSIEYLARNNFELYMDQYVNASVFDYFSISVFSKGVQSESNFKKRYRYTDKGVENTIPTSSNKLQITAGDLIVISKFPNENFVLWSNDRYSRNVLADNVRLSVAAEEYYKNKAADAAFLSILSDHTRTVNKSTPGLVDKGACFDNGNGLTENNSYRTYSFIAQEDMQVYFSDCVSYLSITAYNNNVSLGRLRCNPGSEDTLPKTDSKLSILKGYKVNISILINRDFIMFADGSKLTFGTELSPNLHISKAEHDRMVTLYSDDACKVIYEQGTFEEATSERLAIYVPSKKGYVLYAFNHCVLNTINADNWRINSAYDTDKNRIIKRRLTDRGEWECAIKLSGRPDFSGGIAHGDEVVTNIVFLLDGKNLRANDISELTAFTELKIVEKSTLYDPNDSTTQIAIHYKEYTFDKNGVEINQKVVWLVNAEIENGYLAMFTPHKDVTDTVYNETDYEQYRIVELSPGAIRVKTWTNAKKAVIYGSASGVTGKFEISKYPNFDNTSMMLSDNNGGNYNKIYQTIHIVNVVAGDVWNSTAKYKFEVNG